VTSEFSRNAACVASTLEEAGVDRRDVHVLGLFEDRAARAGLRSEDGLAAQHLGTIEPAHRRHQLGIFGRGLLHGRLLPGAADDQRAARRQERMVGEPVRRLAVETAARYRDGADLGTAIGFRVKRRRPAGCVIGRDMLAFQHDHLGARREMVGGGHSGDAGADHSEIEFLHAPHIARSSVGLQ